MFASHLHNLSKSLSSQRFHASVLGLIYSMRLDGRKDIQSVKSALSVLHAEFKAHVPRSLQGYNEGRKTNIHTQFIFPLREISSSTLFHEISSQKLIVLSLVSFLFFKIFPYHRIEKDM